MTYVMSDIHGCYKEYKKALEEIEFSDEDTLFVLGDCIDRGRDGLKVLFDMMYRANVIPILGDHELWAKLVLEALDADVSEESIEDLSPQMHAVLMDWAADGGDKTLKEFAALTEEQKEDILDYLEEFSLYEEVTVGDKEFVLVHGGLEPFDPKKDLDEYGIQQVVFATPDYDRMYFQDRYTISGHTPTMETDPDNKGRIIHRNDHIAIDCGVVYGFNLAVLCLDTGEEFYIPMEKGK